MPKNIPENDLKWLVNEHFFHPDFLKVRNRNSENRIHLTMLHRTGSTPFRQIMYEELGGKEGKMPTVAEVFKKTRQQKSGALDEESASKLEEIVEKSEENPEFCVRTGGRMLWAARPRSCGLFWIWDEAKGFKRTNSH